MMPYTKRHQRLRQILSDQREAREADIFHKPSFALSSFRCATCGHGRGSRVHKQHMKAAR